MPRAGQARGVTAASGPTPSLTPVPGRATLNATAFDLALVGYVAEEYFIAGDATAYQSIGERSAWNIAPLSSAPYLTRIIVHRPIDPLRANGTTVVEWLNVSAGADTAPDWMAAHRHLIRNGIVWIGVSAQRVGIEGGGAPMLGGKTYLKGANPQRYQSLVHPGDAFSFDMFSQAGRVVRAGLPNCPPPSCLLATGQSQSAFFLTTYINAVDPVVRVFDGFLVHGRSGAAPSLDASRTDQTLAPFRDDPRVPVFVVQSETDTVGRLRAAPVRKPDGPRYRQWEIAGASHADTYIFAVGAVDDGLLDIKTLARDYDPAWVAAFVSHIDKAPHSHYVLQAAFHHLERWTRAGVTPPPGVYLKATLETPRVVDQLGIMRGGVRTPWVDVPVRVYTGLTAGGPGPIAELSGQTLPIDPSVLARLYPGGLEDYGAKFDKSLRRAIKAGYILEADAAENRALARALYPA